MHPCVCRPAPPAKAAISEVLHRAQDSGTVQTSVTVEEVYLLIRGLAQASATMQVRLDTLDRAIEVVLAGLSRRDQAKGHRLIDPGDTARRDHPSLYLTSVRVTAAEADKPSPQPWRPTAFAVCADPLPGLSLWWVTSPANSGDKSVSVPCPKDTRVHGLGARQLGVPGQPPLGPLLILPPGRRSHSGNYPHEASSWDPEWMHASYQLRTCAHLSSRLTRAFGGVLVSQALARITGGRRCWLMRRGGWVSSDPADRTVAAFERARADSRRTR
jgi:hypothetical protein